MLWKSIYRYNNQFVILCVCLLSHTGPMVQEVCVCKFLGFCGLFPLLYHLAIDKSSRSVCPPTRELPKHIVKLLHSVFYSET